MRVHLVDTTDFIITVLIILSQDGFPTQPAHCSTVWVSTLAQSTDAFYWCLYIAVTYARLTSLQSHTCAVVVWNKITQPTAYYIYFPVSTTHISDVHCSSAAICRKKWTLFWYWCASIQAYTCSHFYDSPLQHHWHRHCIGNDGTKMPLPAIFGCNTTLVSTDRLYR